MSSFSEQFKKNCNIPNLLSAVRILVIFPLVYYFLQDNYIASAGILIISGISDMLDGYFARKFNQITKLGAMLDPVADKLTLAAVVICIGIKFTVVMPLVFILIFKELAMLVAGVILLHRRKTPPAAKWYGKLATVVFYLSVTIIVGLKAIWGIESTALTVSFMSITAILMLFALIKYFILFLDELKKDNKKKHYHRTRKSTAVRSDSR